MDPKQTVIDGLSKLPQKYDGRPVRRLLYAIGGHESNWKHLHQIGGPAHSVLQFESAGGLKGIMAHPVTSGLMRELVTAEGLPWNRSEIFDFMDDEEGQAFAISCGRLLLLPDPMAIPNDPKQAFQYYIRCWRPGAYTRGNAATRDALETKFLGWYAEACEVFP